MNTLRPRRPIRVLFVTDHFGYARGVIHGATRYVQTVLPRLDRHEVEPTLFILRDPHPAAQELKQVGLDPVFLSAGKWSPRPLLSLIRLIVSRRIDLLHLYGNKSILLGRLAGRLTGTPVIAHVQDMGRMAWHVRVLHRLTAELTDSALAVSRAADEYATDHLGIRRRRVRVLHSGIVAREFTDVHVGARRELRRAFGIPEDAPVIGVTSQLGPDKGHDTLLRAMRIVVDRLPQARLLIAGEGVERSRLEARLDQLGLKEAVVLAGFRRDVPEVLAAIDVFVFPALRDALAFSLLEAMAAGKPIVATRVGGVPEAITHEVHGLLVPPGEFEPLAFALHRLLLDKALQARFSRRARRRAADFDVTTHVRRLHTHYRAVLGRRTAATRRPGAAMDAITATWPQPLRVEATAPQDAADVSSRMARATDGGPAGARERRSLEPASG